MQLLLVGFFAVPRRGAKKRFYPSPVYLIKRLNRNNTRHTLVRCATITSLQGIIILLHFPFKNYDCYCVSTAALHARESCECSARDIMTLMGEFYFKETINQYFSLNNPELKPSFSRVICVPFTRFVVFGRIIQLVGVFFCIQTRI